VNIPRPLMYIYELYDHQNVLKAHLSVWDFSMDEWAGQWLSEDDRADLVKAIEFFEHHSPHEPAFHTKGVHHSTRPVLKLRLSMIPADEATLIEMADPMHRALE
jgi:hypothetical protein